MANTIAVYNLKGGVGKTSTTLSLAHSWSRTYKILLIDCDPQANLSQALLGEDAIDNELSLYRITKKLLHNSVPDLEPIKIHPYLDLVPGDFKMSGIELNSQFISFGHSIVYRLMSLVKSKYDLIILDFPTHFGMTVKSFIANIDSILIPAIPDSFSASGFKQLLNYLAEVKKEKPLNILGIFFNQFRRSTIYHNEVISEAEQTFGSLILNQRVRQSIKVSEANNATLPIYSLMEEGNDVAGDFLKLSEEVIGRLNTSNLDEVLEILDTEENIG
ncbi:MAG: ParA family protein [Ekhidna sp.]|nr:ParA family protein [Ekhidna sp.]MBC6409504.1 ParA family protein [Ekhidna sp.]MBC6425617.1 ParA family protein [Ekhidna sp.]